MTVHRGMALAVALSVVGGVALGLSEPAAARDARHLINGNSIAQHSISGSKLKRNTVTGAQINESTLGVVPKADIAQRAKSAGVAQSLPNLTWQPLTPLNGWTDFYVDAPRVSYAVDAQGIVHLRGSVYGAAAAVTSPVIFDLPTVLRPAYPIYLSVAESNGPWVSGVLDLDPSGTVEDANLAAPTVISLDGVSWSTG